MVDLAALKGANIGVDFLGREGFANVLGLVEIGGGGEAAGLGVDECDDFHAKGARRLRVGCKDCNAESPFRQSAIAGYGAGMRGCGFLFLMLLAGAATPTTRPTMETLAA